MSKDQNINPDEIRPNLAEMHRDAMLDLVLAWGSLDGAFGMLLSTVAGLPLDKGAEKIGKLSGSAKLLEIRKVLMQVPGGKNAARTISKHKKAYERHSRVRNRIAHSHCVGTWMRDENFIVFAPFEKAGDGLLAVEAISIQEMRRATKWGQAMKALAIKLSNSTK